MESEHQESSITAMDWDPEIDTPATILVIGGGPVGVEAALYARFLGYSVLLIEQRRVGSSLKRWGNQKMAEPWNGATSPLGLAALEAQGAQNLPRGDDTLTCREFVEQYLVPVAKTDLLYESVQIHSRVKSISRFGTRPGRPLSGRQKADLEFRVLIDSRQRGEYSQLVDIVLDCSGLDRRTGLACGGGWAVGEEVARAASELEFGRREILGEESKYANQHTLLFGSDLEACSNALEFGQLCAQAENTRLTWVLPKRIGNKNANILELTSDCVPPDRECMEASIQAIRESALPGVVTIDAWGIESLQPGPTEGWSVVLQRTQDETLTIECDRIIACPTRQPDWQLAPELDLSPLQDVEPDCSNLGRQGCVTREPNYYVLGAKSVDSTACTLAQAREQIRRVFGLVGGRGELNLYETFKPHPG